MCLAHVMLPKPESRADPELWPMHGKPQCVHVDNGKDLKSYALKSAKAGPKAPVKRTRSRKA